MEDSRRIMVIIDIVSDYFKIVNINTKNRKREIVQARQIMHYFSKKYTSYSLAKIGEKIGNKNHSTVLYGDREIKKRITVERFLREDIEILDHEFIKTFIINYREKKRIKELDKMIQNNIEYYDILLIVKKEKYTIIYHSIKNKIEL